MTQIVSRLAALAKRRKVVNKKRWYVTIVKRDQAYGGPEEGGWWYPTQEVVSSPHNQSFHLEDEARRYQDRLWTETVEKWNEGRYPIDSVLSEGIYDVCLSEGPTENLPKVRPHYE